MVRVLGQSRLAVATGLSVCDKCNQIPTPREALLKRSTVMHGLNQRGSIMLAFVFRLVYHLFCKKYFAVLRKYRRLGDRWA